MQQTVKSVNYFDCGYCVNNLGRVFKGMHEKRKFPAGVFLIEHSKHGLILFDTGYSEKICKTGIIGRIYNLANPTKVSKQDTIKSQLKKQGIETNKIKYIILSHLHPDHIGGLLDFPKAKIILSANALDAYHHRSLRQLIMKQFIPKDFEERVIEITKEKMNKTVFDNLKGHDLFDDKSIILVELEGHARGQLCALINHKILLAADSCWGNDLLDISDKMKFPANLIQYNMDDYRKSLEILKQFRKDGIRLMFSHDTYNRKKVL